MGGISDFLNGQKTNIGMVLLGLVGILMHQGIIPKDWGEMALIGIGSFTGVAIRQGMKKIGQKAPAKKKT